MYGEWVNENKRFLLVILSVFAGGGSILTYILPSQADSQNGINLSYKPFIRVNIDTDSNFSFLKQEVTSGVIYRGLPSKYMDKENFKKASSKPHFKKGGDYFYKESKELDADFISHVIEILKTKDALGAYPKVDANTGLGVVIKFCGGFHADYMVTLKTQTQKVDIQICYGCEDIKLYLDDVFIGQYDFDTEYAFEKWTKSYENMGLD